MKSTEAIANVGLTSWERCCIVSCLVDGWTQKTVAGWFGTSQQAVADTIRRANRKLKAAGLPPAQKRSRSIVVNHA